MMQEMEMIFIATVIFLCGFVTGLLILTILTFVRNYMYKRNKKRKREEFHKKMEDLEIK